MPERLPPRLDEIARTTWPSSQDYNFRAYAQRRVAAGFRENMRAEPAEATELLAAAEPQLEMIRRQALINSMYHGGESVMSAFASQRAQAGVPSGAPAPSA